MRGPCCQSWGPWLQLSGEGHREGVPWWSGDRPQRSWPLGDQLSLRPPPRSDPEIRRLALLVVGAGPVGISGHLFSPTETPGSLRSHSWRVPCGSKGQGLK